jgi:hypothetical protein
MSNDYPAYHSLIQKLAGKIITRVVKNGAPLSSAIKDVIDFADLDRQQIIHLCSILQEYNMPYNGDPMDFFRMSEDMGKNFPNPADGYVVYASSGSMQPVFTAIDQLKEAGFTSKQIVAMNEELGPIVDTMDQADSASEEDSNEDVAPSGEERQKLIASFMSSISSDYAFADEMDAISDEAINELQQALDKVERIEGSTQTTIAPAEEEFALAASSRIKNLKKAQLEDVAPTEGGEVAAEEPNPENIKGLLDEANAPEGGDEAATGGGLDLGDTGTDDAGDLGLGDDLGGEEGSVSAKVSPAPSELKERLSSKPEWSIDNILSIQQAEKFLEGIRKDMEAVVFNENIILDQDSVKQYDDIREMIDGELEKIKEAQKQTKKLEDKENDLEEEFQVNDQNQEVPTEEMIGPKKEEAPAEEISVKE